jgi:hypothetical protein
MTPGQNAKGAFDCVYRMDAWRKLRDATDPKLDSIAEDASPSPI